MKVVARKWILAKQWDGMPTVENFVMKEEILDPSTLKKGGILCEAIFYSVDPYMRIEVIHDAFKKSSISDAMIGTQVARVTHSESAMFPAGCLVMGDLGWRSHTITTEDRVRPLPEMGGLPASLALGTLGLTGVTAYLGTHDVLAPKKGDTVVVSSAAGAVGSIVGQIAKLMDCTVIGFTGSNEKCDWLKNDLDFDHVFNYKEISVDEALKIAAPDGVDCYYDNVGGEFTWRMVRHMKMHGRMAMVGSISTYAYGEDQPKGPYPYYDILLRRIKMQGFAAFDHIDRWPKAIEEMCAWIEEGKLKYKEHITEGFDNMPRAFLELFTGGNIGKAIVKA